MTTHDPINSYLNNEMSPDQERQFLISVASSDTLRRALKSHVMIDRIIVQEEREMAVPHTLRTAILAEAGTFAPTPSVELPYQAARTGAAGNMWGRLLGGSAIAGLGVALGWLLAPALPRETQVLHPRQNPPMASAAIVSASIVPVPIPVPEGEPMPPQVIVRQGSGVSVEPRTIVRYVQTPGGGVRATTETAKGAVEFAPRDNPLDPRHDNPLDPGPTRQGTDPASLGSTGRPLGPGR